MRPETTTLMDGQIQTNGEPNIRPSKSYQEGNSIYPKLPISQPLESPIESPQFIWLKVQFLQLYSIIRVYTNKGPKMISDLACPGYYLV